MSVKPPLKFGYATLRFAGRAMKRRELLAKGFPLCRLGMLGMNPNRARRGAASSSHNANKWQLQLEIERSKDEGQLLSLPMLIYLYSPWKRLNTKLNLLKLKLLWDWQFVESEFVDNSKQAIVVISKFILEGREHYMQRCTTPMGLKQIKHDLLKSENQYCHNWPTKLLRFEKRHIRRAIPIKVQRLSHYDHKFAFVDMIFLACRRANDFQAKWEIREIRNLIVQNAKTDKAMATNPIIFAEFFVRFRRDYSLPPTVRAGHWLVSTYKILQFDVLNYHPEFRVGSGIDKLNRTVQPLSRGSSQN